MTLAIALAVGALAVAGAAPAVLQALLRRGVDPGALLGTWAGLVISTSASLGASIVLILLPGHGSGRNLYQLLHQCWLSLQTGVPPRAEELAGLAGAGVSVVALVRCARRLTRYTTRRRAVHRQHLALLRIMSGQQPARTSTTTSATTSTLWLDTAEPVAYSVAGRPSLVVASSGLRSRLDDAEVAAVLAHEHAHLRGRHHVLVAVADAVAGALPWLPLMHHSPAFVQVAVEVAADSSAARSCSARTVRSALSHMPRHRTPAAALGIAADDVTLRLRVLDRTRRPGGVLRRVTCAVTAGAAATALPVLTSTVLLAVAGLACFA